MSNKGKKHQFTPWQIKVDPLDRIPEVTQNLIKYRNNSNVSVCLQNVKTQSQSLSKVRKKSQIYIEKARKQFSIRQREHSQRQVLVLKPLQLQKHIQANKNFICSIRQVQRHKSAIQDSFKQLAILNLIQNQLSLQKKNNHLFQIKGKYQCLFPLINPANNKQKRLNNRSLNHILVNHS